MEDALERLGHDVVPIDVDSTLVERLREAHVDVAFVALHGRGGEDGTVQELLEIVGSPLHGSGVLACMRSMDKVLTKHLLVSEGIPTPDFFAFSEVAFREFGAADALPAIEERLGFPIVIKPAAQGSALGIKFAALGTRTCPRRWSQPSATTTAFCSSATSRAVSSPSACSTASGISKRCRSWRRSRRRSTSTTSRPATRSARPTSSAPPTCRPRWPTRLSSWRSPPTGCSGATGSGAST